MEKSARATYYLKLPVPVIDEWEKIRQEKGYEKCYMATQAFRHYIDNVLGVEPKHNSLKEETA